MCVCVQECVTDQGVYVLRVGRYVCIPASVFISLVEGYSVRYFGIHY